jgi:CRP-like cAMP-binding protein
MTAHSSSNTPNSSESRFARTSVPGNQLLAHLPGAVRANLEPHLHRVDLKRGQPIFRAHEPLQTVYFPETGVLSLLTHLNAGEVLDVALVGKDGLAGVALLPGVNMMPCDATVEISGTALRMNGDLLKHQVRDVPPFRELLGRYAYSLFASGVQTAACNTFHSVKQRCARWLLMTHDLVEGDEIRMTHNLLATMLGVRRSTVTIVAGSLQRARLITYRHGRLTIRDRPGLQAASCDCYRLMREEQHRLLGY